jgi:uncharacterized protein
LYDVPFGRRGREERLSNLQILVLMLVGSGAGFLGAIAGVGGGIIITPVLTIYFGVPLTQAVGTSLIAVITTSAASSSVHVQRHVADIKLGMTLELATALGAAVTAYFAPHVNRNVVAILFVIFLCYSAYNIGKKMLQSSTKASAGEIPHYEPKHYPLGLSSSLVAGGMSGLLGIGGGPIKVPIMYIFMGVPLLVATATSNFMIGVTAAASAVVYFRRGDVLLTAVVPLVVGVFVGSTVGAKAAHKMNSRYVMGLLIAIMVLLAIQMAIRVAKGHMG